MSQLNRIARRRDAAIPGRLRVASFDAESGNSAGFVRRAQGQCGGWKAGRLLQVLGMPRTVNSTTRSSQQFGDYE